MPEIQKGDLIVFVFLGVAVLFGLLILGCVIVLSRGKQSAPGGDVQVAEPRKCPFCAEDIELEAVVCKHCGKEVSNTH